MLNAVGLDIDLDRSLVSLALGERQLLEIAGALSVRCKVSALGEPPAEPSPSESARLFGVIEALRRRGDEMLGHGESGRGHTLSLAYPYEVNDIPMITLHHGTAPAFADMVIDNFDEMLA